MSSDEELSAMIEISLLAYIRMLQTEEIADSILKSYDITFNSKNDRFKFNYEQLMLCADLRSIPVPNYLYDTKVTLDDIIERIEEQMQAKFTMN